MLVAGRSAVAGTSGSVAAAGGPTVAGTPEIAAAEGSLAAEGMPVNVTKAGSVTAMAGAAEFESAGTSSEIPQ